jgi:hypothetical protein
MALVACPRRDQRQNFAGLDALRKGKDFKEEVDDGIYAKTFVLRTRGRSLDGGSKSPFVGLAAKRGQCSFMRGNS